MDVRGHIVMSEQSFLLLHRRTRGSRARATPASDTIRGQRRHSPTHPNLATSRQPPQRTVEMNTTLELLLPRTHFVTRGSISNAFPVGNVLTVTTTMR